MSLLEIALVDLGDLEALVGIEELSFPDPWSAELLRGELELPRSRRYTKALRDGEIVGYLGLMFVDDEVHVNTLATLPASQGRGVATRLLLEGIEASLERGGRHLTLEVAVSNQRAQALYRRFGLAPVFIAGAGLSSCRRLSRSLSFSCNADRRRTPERLRPMRRPRAPIPL